MKCPRCGAENEEGRAACWKCYAPLTGASREAHEKQALQPQFIPAPKIEERPARGRPSPLGKILTLVIILAIAGGAGWWFFLRVPNTPKGVVLAFLKASKKGDLKKALRFCSESTRGLLGKEGLSKEQLNFKPPARGKVEVHYRVKGVSVSGDKATVKVALDVKGGKAGEALPEGLDTMPFVAVKEKGKWGVDLMATVTEMMGAAFGELMKQAPQWPSTPGTAPGWGTQPAPAPSR